jgi:hypothetical protein
MAKTNGLNCRLYVEGYDLSGDANSLSGLGYTNELLDVTTLDVSAKKRLIGTVDTEMSFDAWFDNAASHQHAVWSSNSGKLPTTDQDILIPMGSAVGDQFVGLIAKEGTYNVARSGGSAISANATFSANGSTAEYGEMLTAFDDTHSSAGSGTVVDSGASSSNGGTGFLQLLSLDSGSVTVNLQEATSSGGTYTNFMTFSTVAAAAAPSAERLTNTGTVQRYIKVTTTGTFSNAKIVVGFSRS